MQVTQHTGSISVGKISLKLGGSTEKFLFFSPSTLLLARVVYTQFSHL